MSEEYQDAYLKGDLCIIGKAKYKVCRSLKEKGEVYWGDKIEDIRKAVNNKKIKYIVLDARKKTADLGVFKKAYENNKMFLVPFWCFFGKNNWQGLRNFEKLILFERKSKAKLFLVNLCEKKKMQKRRNFEYFMSFFGRKIRRRIE